MRKKTFLWCTSLLLGRRLCLGCGCTPRRKECVGENRKKWKKESVKVFFFRHRSGWADVGVQTEHAAKHMSMKLLARNRSRAAGWLKLMVLGKCGGSLITQATTQLPLSGLRFRKQMQIEMALSSNNIKYALNEFTRRYSHSRPVDTLNYLMAQKYFAEWMKMNEWSRETMKS